MRFKNRFLPLDLRWNAIFVFLAFAGNAATLFGAEPIGSDYLDAAKKYKFSIIYRLDAETGMTGKPTTRYPLEKAFSRFFAALELLPMDFIEKIGLKKVAIVQGLQIDGGDCDGASDDGLLALDEEFERSTVYHEMYHLLDPFVEPKSDPEWNRLNPPGFVYTGSDFYRADVAPSDENKVKQEKKKPDLTNFVTEYASSFDYEDRAETFSLMIDEGADFLQRTRRSPVMKAKMDYIVKLTEERGFLSAKFWEKTFSRRPAF